MFMTIIHRLGGVPLLWKYSHAPENDSTSYQPDPHRVRIPAVIKKFIENHDFRKIHLKVRFFWENTKFPRNTRYQCRKLWVLLTTTRAQVSIPLRETHYGFPPWTSKKTFWCAFVTLGGTRSLSKGSTGRIAVSAPLSARHPGSLPISVRDRQSRDSREEELTRERHTHKINPLRNRWSPEGSKYSVIAVEISQISVKRSDTDTEKCFCCALLNRKRDGVFLRFQRKSQKIRVFYFNQGVRFP